MSNAFYIIGKLIIKLFPDKYTSYLVKKMEPITEHYNITSPSSTEDCLTIKKLHVDLQPEIEDTQMDSIQLHNLLDILNYDCLTHILNYIHIEDLVRSKRISKRWHNMIEEYLQSLRSLSTSCVRQRRLTTAMLEQVLLRMGGSLLRLYVDHCSMMDMLDHQIPYLISNLCPNLKELWVYGKATEFWKPLSKGCKQLKKLTFICFRKGDSNMFSPVLMTYSMELIINSLSFGLGLNTVEDTLPNLTVLQLDGQRLLWPVIPKILNKLTKLQELSLNRYAAAKTENGDFCKAISALTELKTLKLSYNYNVSNNLLKIVAQTCLKLESLTISSCNLNGTWNKGVGDKGVMAICSGCPLLSMLDVSHLLALSDAGLCAATQLSRLETLKASDNAALSALPFSAIISACPHLKEVDARRCRNVSIEVVESANTALLMHPRALTLYLDDDNPLIYKTHKLLKVKLDNPQYSNSPHLWCYTSCSCLGLSNYI